MNKLSVPKTAPIVKFPHSGSSVTLPVGHKFFPDCLRENHARLIEWSISRRGQSAWFVNQTFKQYQETRSAKRLFRTWVGRLKEALESSGGGQLRWVLATEWQIREVIHFHSLVQGLGMDQLSRMRWEDRWETMNRNAGFCRIYNADRKAAPYLAKYTSKALGGELEWGGYWQGLNSPASVSCGHSISL